MVLVVVVVEVVVVVVEVIATLVLHTYQRRKSRANIQCLQLLVLSMVATLLA
jgi:hypothetical protein